MTHPKLWGTTDTRNGLPTTTRESPDFSHGECQYHGKFERNGNPCVKISCLYRDKEIREIPKEEMENCPHFKKVKDIMYYVEY